MNQEQILQNREELFQNPNFSSYKWQLQNRITSKDLEKTVRLNVGCTPYYLSLSDPFDPNCPIRRMIVPTESETFISPEESPDPLHEERLSPVKGLTHMYEDRVLLFSNYECAVYCRHCMRGRKVSNSEERMEYADLDRAFEYIQKNSQIRDVVISGGDPLNLSDKKLEYILKNLEEISHVEICRIGTRNPVTLPMRITPELCELLEKYNTDKLSIFCNTQFNHPKECTKEAKESILRLLKAGISVGNQCVILKGINDNGQTMLNLHRELLKMRVRAYYMYDPEVIPGSRGFRTPLGKGLEILSYMRGKISGMGIPHFVNDLPGGGGKITLTPNWYLGYNRTNRIHVFLSAAKGTYHLSPEPYPSEYENTYPTISDEEFELISKTALGVHEKLIQI